MNWTSNEWKQVIFLDESMSYVLKRQNQCKIWRLEKKSYYQSACSQQILVMVRKLEFGEVFLALGATIAKIYIENMNGKVDCDVL